jgi:hypothetical protein
LLRRLGLHTVLAITPGAADTDAPGSGE